MSDTEQSKSLDILGIKPVGEAVKIATEATVRQAEEFLSIICKPAAKEFGLLLKDQVKEWRQANLVRIANKAEKKLKEEVGEKAVHAHPRVVTQACESGSWIDDDNMQEMWAGLIASACTEDGKDDSNLIFVQLLGQLTSTQANLIKNLCEQSKYYREDTGWVYAGMGEWNSRELAASAGYDTSDRFRTEISHLRQLGLVDVWFDRDERQHIRCGPTVLALDLYVRCQGSRQTITNYYSEQAPLGDEDVVDYPNNTARAAGSSIDDLRDELGEPKVEFSVGLEVNSFCVGVKNVGLVPIHESQLSVVIPLGQGDLKANFNLDKKHTTVLIPGETQRWRFPLTQAHFMLGQPIETSPTKLNARPLSSGKLDGKIGGFDHTKS